MVSDSKQHYFTAVFFKVNSKVKKTVITSNRFKTAFVKYLYFIHSMTEFTVTLTVKKTLIVIIDDFYINFGGQFKYTD